MPQDATTTFALALLHELSAMGGDPSEVLKRARLPFTLDELEQGRQGGISDQQFVRLHHECIDVFAAQANRERNLPPMSYDEVELLCHCLITSANLGEVIDRAKRFCAMLGGRAAELTLELHGTDAVFHMVTQRLRGSASALFTDLHGLSFYRRLFSWLIGERIPIAAYRVYASAVVDRDVLERFLQDTILFDQPDNAFVFPAHLLDKPVIRNAEALAEVLDVLPFDAMRDPRDGGRFAEAIEHIAHTRLSRQLPVPTLDQFARVFNMSGATLQRRLREEGSSFNGIRQRARLRFAEELLEPARALKISGIAERLGFSDARSFRRAFVEWTGLTPDAWRQRRG